MDEDKVELVLNGETVLTSKDYDVSIAFLQVPNAFALTIGSGGTAVDLMRRYPKRTPFALRINGITQFMGWTDGFRRPRGSATELQITGRDALAQLLTDEIQHDRSWNNATFEELARAAFTGAGYDGISLIYDAAAHRRAVTGTPVTETVKTKKKIVSAPVGTQGAEQGIIPLTPDGSAYDVGPVVRLGVTTVETEVEEIRQRVTGFKAEKPIEWKAGTAYYAALNKELARGGIFLRAGVDPEGQDPNVFLLGEPNAAQAPLFGLARVLEGNPPANIVNVVPPAIDDLATGRHAYYIVRGRTGNGKSGKQQIEATFTDEEMVALGYTTHKVIMDESCKTLKQAQYMARKACAEARRQGRVFTYTVPRRHSLPLLADANKRAIPTPDVVVTLRDDEHGMFGDFWIERVRFRGSSSGGTATDITLMVPDDLVFGEGEFYTSGKKRRKVFGRSV